MHMSTHSHFHCLADDYGKVILHLSPSGGKVNVARTRKQHEGPLMRQWDSANNRLDIGLRVQHLLRRSQLIEILNRGQSRCKPMYVSGYSGSKNDQLYSNEGMQPTLFFMLRK